MSDKIGSTITRDSLVAKVGSPTDKKKPVERLTRITSHQFKKAILYDPYFAWHPVEVSDDMDENNFSFIMPDEVVEELSNYSETQMKAYGLVEKELNKFIETTFKDPEFIVGKSADDKIQATLDTFNGEWNSIVNPIFIAEYKGYDLVARPTVVEKTDDGLILYYGKLSASNKITDTVPMSFDLFVFELLGIKIVAIKQILMMTKKYKKGEVEFTFTGAVNPGKTTKQVPKKEMYSKSEIMHMSEYEENLFKQNKYKTGNGEIYDRKLKTYIVDNTVNILSQTNLYVTPAHTRDIVNLIALAEAMPEPNSFMVTNFSSPLLRKYILEKNKYWAEISHATIMKYFFKDLGRTWEEYLSYENDEFRAKAKKEWESIYKEKIKIDKSKLLDKFVEPIKNSKVVWYDFESMSLPYCPMDNVLPYNQLVSQVSIVTTNKNLVEVSNKNLIVDPKNISLESMMEIIDAIHLEEQDVKYVVYFKDYENTRLREMAMHMRIEKHPKATEYTNKVLGIIENTIDLNEAFKMSSLKPDKFPPFFIRDLKGKSSIKLIEKFITANYPELRTKANVKEYKNLEVRNGLMAMERANERALGVLGDNKWIEVSENLKTYCENDVRAMIMVYYLIEKFATVLEKKTYKVK